MAQPKALVLRAAGTNCDRETAYALEQAGFTAERLHLFRLIERPEALAEYQFLVVPGGFSYGDDISAGKIFANQLLYRLAGPLNEFTAAGKLVLGICNGMQVLLKCGLLPEARVDPARAGREVTVGWNDLGRFEDRWVHLRVEGDRCAFLPPGEILQMPIAHAEGKFIPRDDGVLQRLEGSGQLVLRYCDERGEPGGYPVNPNGSVADVAGLCDPTGRVLALMPHPERFVEITQHPHWTGGRVRRADGRLLFERARQFFDQH